MSAYFHDYEIKFNGILISVKKIIIYLMLNFSVSLLHLVLVISMILSMK